MKKFVTTTLFMILATNSAFAVLMDFNSVSVSNNAAKMAEWYAAMGITQSQYYVNFENIAVGTNVENNTSFFTNMVISVSSGDAIVRSNTNYFGGSYPGPAGSTRALALTGNQTLTLTFSTPVDYLSFFDIDISDSAGGNVYFTDGTSTFFDDGNEESYTSGNTATFYGLYSTDKKITFITFRDSGGDGDLGIDEIRYGVIPEPATLTILCLGTLAFIKHKGASNNLKD